MGTSPTFLSTCDAISFAGCKCSSLQPQDEELASLAIYLGWQHAIQVMQPMTAHRDEQRPPDKGKRTLKSDRRVLDLRPARLVLFYLGQRRAPGNPVGSGAFARRYTHTLRGNP